MLVIGEDPFYQKVTNCVYVGYDMNGCFKIGMSNNWGRRAKEIRNMNPAYDVLCETQNIASWASAER